MTITHRRRWRTTILGAVAVTALLAGPAVAQKVLRVIPQADLKNLDPHWTTAAITQNHGFMIYDTLFALDGKLLPQPQMVDKHVASADGLSHSMTLRAGMKFHDGSPVTAKDAVASVKRWAARNTGGQAMMAAVASLEATGDLTFEFKMSRPFGLLTRVLADPSLPAFIMREQEAKTDPFQQVTEQIGSGPFTFDKPNYVPGAKVVYRKFAGYAARAEPVSGMAGNKSANVDVVEWLYIPDVNTATQALLKGEADVFEQPSYDLLPLLTRDRNITVKVLDTLGKMGHVRPNHLHPPFNNVKAREALQLMVGQSDFLAAMVGNKTYEKECFAIFMCGSPFETQAHSERYRKADLARAKQLLQEAGYKGEEVVIMQPTDQQLIGVIAQLTAQVMRDAGMKVRIDALDWSSLTSRRTNQDAPGPGSAGWNIFTTWWTGVPMSSPITSAPLVSTCDRKNWFGWPCDEQTEKLRADFLVAPDLEAQKRVTEALQKRYYETFPYVNTGQFFAPVAWRNNIVNVPDALLFVAWGLDKR